MGARAKPLPGTRPHRQPADKNLNTTPGRRLPNETAAGCAKNLLRWIDMRNERKKFEYGSYLGALEINLKFKEEQ
jgi:hypothetical protein